MRRPKLALREMQPAEYRMLGITLDSKSELWVHPDTRLTRRSCQPVQRESAWGLLSS